MVGPEGVGKATLAYHLAREVLPPRGVERGFDHDRSPVFRKGGGLGHPNCC
jgi:DNA polymerase III delta prime subunit